MDDGILRDRGGEGDRWMLGYWGQGWGGKQVDDGILRDGEGDRWMLVYWETGGCWDIGDRGGEGGRWMMGY